MFKETADDGANANAVGHAFDAGAQYAEAADDEVDFDAGLGGLIESVNDGWLEERIHLGDDVGGAACPGVFRFAANEAEKTFSHGERRDEKRAVVVDLGVRGEVVEDHVHALGDLRIAGEYAEVGVEARGDGVVVAGAEVAVAAGYAIFVAAHKQGELAVGLETDDAVKHLYAGVFHAARPADVGRFVEAGHELDNQRGFFSGRGFNECGEYGRVLAGAIEGLLHADDGGVFGAGLNEVDYRVVGIVWMMQQDVVLTEFIEDVF